MAHLHTSGVYNRGIRAWHGLGTVINDETLTAAAAFEMADALFPVNKQPLFYKWQPDESAPAEARLSRRSSLIHGITGAELGVCGDGYEIVHNERLLEMAEAVEDQIIMDAVCVLDEGRRIAFTGLIRDTGGAVVQGDPITRFIVGYLGHDGATGIGSLYTDVRVVCANTLAMAMASTNQRSLSHRPGVNKEVTALIHSIDVARRRFDKDLEEYQQMADTAMDAQQYLLMLQEVFAPELAKPVRNGNELRPRRLHDLRIFPDLIKAPAEGIGTEISGVKNTAWGYYNALTEVLTSQNTVDAQNGIKRFNRALFGVNQRRLTVARQFCRQLAGIQGA